LDLGVGDLCVAFDGLIRIPPLRSGHFSLFASSMIGVLRTRDW